MRNSIIRIIAFILTLISICTFIIGSTFRGISSSFHFDGYMSYEEFYEGENESQALDYLESSMSYFENYARSSSKENFLELVEYDAINYLDYTHIRVTDENNSVLFDNVSLDESEYLTSYKQTIEIKGYQNGEIAYFDLGYLDEFKHLYSLSEIEGNFYLKENGTISYIEPITNIDEDSLIVSYTINGEVYKSGDRFTGANNEIFELNEYGELVTIQSGELSSTLVVELFYNQDSSSGYAYSFTGSSSDGMNEILEQVYCTRNIIDEIIIISAIICAISLFILITYTGKQKGTNEISLNFIDRMPLEITICINLGLSALIYTYGWLFYETSYNLMLLSLGFIVLIQLISLVTIVVRLKSKTLIKNSFTYIVIKWLLSPIRYFMGVLRYAFLEVPLVLKAVIIVIALGLLALIGVISSYFLWSIAMLASAMIFLITYFYLANLKSSIKKISQGDLDYKTDTKYMILDFKEMAEDLNKINEGLEEATQKKIKSERLKAELITNVSHDIKTPLTSIINYVDLIKKQNIQDETVNEYIEVLDRQSQKLKRLTSDLVDASKINSGNIDSKLEDVNISVVLGQIEGEYKEKLSQKSLNLIVNYPNEDLIIKADGKHLNRIIDNLMINILKYSLENTRVYIDVKNSENLVSVIIKNTSKTQLNISADELMQRFVRGDESRNTEGNGLGLSIAQSLATVQEAHLDITVDGDLFKAEIVFNKN